MSIAFLVAVVGLWLWAILAGYESRCGICDGHIEEGELIVMVDGEWVHEHCAAEDE